MVLRCYSCKGTEFEIEAFELVRRVFDSADIGDEWKQSEPLEESYVISARCAECDEEYPPEMFGLSLKELQKRMR